MVALQEIDYPQQALKLRAGGKVTLAGVIDRKGGIRQLRIVSADIHPDDATPWETLPAGDSIPETTRRLFKSFTRLK